MGADNANVQSGSVGLKRNLRFADLVFRHGYDALHFSRWSRRAFMPAWQSGPLGPGWFLCGAREWVECDALLSVLLFGAGAVKRLESCEMFPQVVR